MIVIVEVVEESEGNNMEKRMFVCDVCGKTSDCKMTYVRKKRKEDITFVDVHFCSENCIVEYYTKWAKEIWARQESMRCRWSGKECDYEGVGGKGYCERCAREYSGTR